MNGKKNPQSISRLKALCIIITQGLQILSQKGIKLQLIFEIHTQDMVLF